MKQHEKKPGNQKAKNVVEILLVIAAILLIPLFFAIRTAANPPATQKTATPHNLAATSAPAPVTTAKEPPPCTFPLAQITAIGSASEDYTFSEPKVVLTAKPSESNIAVVDWLPDNQRVLITRESRDTTQESIEVFNPETGAARTFAIRRRIDQPPSWLPGLDAVLYPAMNITKDDTISHHYEFTRQARVSHGSPDDTQLVADNLSQFSIAVKPQGSEILYLSGDQMSKRNASLLKSPTVKFVPAQWDYRRENNTVPISYMMAWRPGTSQIFFYSDGNTGGGYTFLLDANSGQICELDFGGWAGVGRWSSDGRYLAITRATEGYPINSSDLAVLDTETGKVETVQIAPQEITGRHYVGDLVWARDNIHLVAIGYVLPFPPTGRLDDEHRFNGLYLVDIVSGQSTHLLPDYKFFTGWPGTNLAWSTDGSKLLVRCPANDNVRLCLISVRITGQ
jgi:hypothetical protein